MLTAVKNQGRVTFLSIKYSVMREMINKTTFITNILFMILNNACFIVQWVVLYSLQDQIGGYSFTQVLLLWGMAAGSYGVSHFFFENAYTLSDQITEGKLDAYLVQPKNVLLSLITSKVKTSALGDMLYGYIMCIFAHVSILHYLLFTFLSICGGLILTGFAIVLGSFSFWIKKADMLAETGNGWMTSFSNYPDGIFKGVVKVLLYTLIPVGIVSYLPVSILSEFKLPLFGIVVGFTILMVVLAFLVFYRGLKRYSSSNLMGVRM